jgi:hypothetical protein
MVNSRGAEQRILFSLGPHRKAPLAAPETDDNKNLPGFSSADSPTLVLISGAVLLGGIGAFIAWGLTHAYPAA